MNQYRPTWAEINLANIVHNMQEFRQHIHSSARLMAVVKADGYGHGAVEVARAALTAGADWLAVALVEEGIKLRQAGLAAPILVLGYLPPEAVPAVIQYHLTPGVVDRATLDLLADEARRQRRRLGVHVKIDTGMGRLGPPPQQGIDLARQAIGYAHLELEGVYTHFAAADENKEFTLAQLDKFKKVVETIREDKGSVMAHCSNSAGAISYPQAWLDMVRIGLSLYGLYPSAEARKMVRLKPALSFYTRVAFVKEVPKGTPISYGCTFVADRPSRIATLPVGYADGYWRALSGQGQVLIGGCRVPLVGRVCMDYCMADVTDLPEVAAGAPVVLYGRQGDQEITVDEVARQVGTINYEITCAISARVPRVYRYQT